MNHKKILVFAAGGLLLGALSWGGYRLFLPGRVQKALAENSRDLALIETSDASMKLEKDFGEAEKQNAEAGAFSAAGKHPDAWRAAKAARRLKTALKEKLALKNRVRYSDKMLEAEKAEKAGNPEAALAAYELALHFQPGDTAAAAAAAGLRDKIAALKAAGETAREKAMAVKAQGMALVTAGSFFMGSREGVGESDEHPRHKVYLDAFYIDKREVTISQYVRFNQATRRKQPDAWSTGNQYPANTDWDGAYAYCAWAGKRLPTEAEWEKAARGRTSTNYSFGDDPARLAAYAWYDTNSKERAHQVGERKPNQYGLYDIYGNVWEWAADRYDKEYYLTSPKKNPKGPPAGSSRVLRGGSWSRSADELLVANRGAAFPDSNLDGVGFRCALDAGQK